MKKTPRKKLPQTLTTAVAGIGRVYFIAEEIMGGKYFFATLDRKGRVYVSVYAEEMPS